MPDTCWLFMTRHGIAADQSVVAVKEERNENAIRKKISVHYYGGWPASCPRLPHENQTAIWA
eukprot:scaffold253626_cov39-Prasinocladus_malaysianus.AAC.1